MKRRVTTRGKATKTLRRKVAKSGSAPSTMHRRRSTGVGLQEQLDEARRELREAREQQTATSEVLKVISRTPGELNAVFESLLDNAIRICGARFGNLFLYRDGAFTAAVMRNAPAEFLRARTKGPNRPGPDTALGRVERTKKVVQIADLRTEPQYKAGEPFAVSGVELGGIRTLVSVPMLKDGELIGAFNIYRQEVLSFTDRQVDLLSNFADQAVIAIENTRLLNELRQRTDDLSESLEQQTATSEVLKVISSSPGQLQPVFETMLSNMCRICDAQFSGLLLREGDAFQRVALHGAPPAYADLWNRERVIHRGAGTIPDQTVKTKRAIQVVGLKREQSPALFELAGAQTLLSVPLIKDNEVVGVISIYRQEVRPFTDKQIELVQNFAAQAVIAIENTRLLNELRESLQQQTATADVLKVISGTPGELQPVFDTMLTKATALCEASYGALWLCQDGGFRYVALHGDLPRIYTDYMRNGTVIRVKPEVPLARVAETRKPVQVPDMRVDPSYLSGDPLPVSGVEVGGIRTLALVPMVKDDALVGMIAMYRKEVRPFTEKQIELVQNFAAQAVIAIENARLLNELRESLQQQTATADVLRVINSSPGSLKPVFESMLEKAMQLCDAAFGGLWTLEGDRYTAVALRGVPQPYAAFLTETTFVPGPGTAPRRILQGEALVHNLDLAAEEPYRRSDLQRRALVDLGGARTALQVPLRKENKVLGIITIYRQEVRPFTDKQIELVQNFAAQAVIAIENTRLLNELRESLQQQSATADVLKVISRSTFNLQTVLDTLTGSAARLCEAEMAAITRQRADAYYYTATHGYPAEVDQYLRSVPHHAFPGSVVGRALLAGKIIHIHDVLSDPEYKMGDVARKAGVRTVLGVPLLREGLPIGVIVLARGDVQPFTDAQIALVSTFADQAVIAIENVRLFDEIQDKSRQLAEASQHKSQFLANMSHELRTPLNAILGYTELILDGIYGETPEKALAVLKRVESNGKHLLGLINDVLDLSKIEAGQLKLSFDNYSLKDVVHNVFIAVEPLATKKNLDFKVDVPADMPAGYGDEQKVTQVLLNLAGNAIKFTDTGEVAIRVTATNGAFSVAVKDTGPGISPADQTKLFQQFQQADNSITKSKGGTGLGLAISKRIIELHGGSISVESSVGHGSTFTVALPLRAERQANPP